VTQNASGQNFNTIKKHTNAFFAKLFAACRQIATHDCSGNCNTYITAESLDQADKVAQCDYCGAIRNSLKSGGTTRRSSG
jgi:hypothetical protein